jgi:hypothetical protein
MAERHRLLWTGLLAAVAAAVAIATPSVLAATSALGAD